MKNKILLILLLIGFCQFLSLNTANAFGLPDFSSIKVKSPSAWFKPKPGTPEREALYKKNILKQEAIERYERSLLPESGYMTADEYEDLSKDIPNSDKVITEYKLPRDIKMQYVPQPVYKLTKYNDPPGSPELHIGRSYKYDRQFICPGITSPNKDILVYPTLNYYVNNQCTSCDLFVIPLDKSLPDITRIQRANIIKRNPEPIMSTSKDIRERFIFRSLTPVDFSTDGSKLIVKEKVGNVNDGIWKTKLWVYDFATKQSKQLSEVRDAIKFYWQNSKNLMLDEKRWDIYPLGFDAKNPERIVIYAMGYTGKTPVFLGLWSVDCNGERSLLLSVLDAKANISENGVKIVKAGVLTPTVVEAEEKKLNKIIKKRRKDEAKKAKQELKKKKQELKKELREINKQNPVKK